MGHPRIVSGLLLMVLLAANSANAVDWNRVKLDWHRSNSWPEPFRYTDRQSVRSAWAIQQAKGWRIETTLGAHHFDIKTNELTAAGSAKLYWILSHAPPANRTVYIVRAREIDTTEIRVDSVQQTVAKMLPEGSLPAVVRTINAAPSTRGDYLDKVWEQRNATIPAPVLPREADPSGG